MHTSFKTYNKVEWNIKYTIPLLRLSFDKAVEYTRSRNQTMFALCIDLGRVT